MGYISRRAVIGGVASESAVILGRSEVGEETFLDEFVCIGYPRRDKLLEFSRKLRDLDKLSFGARIGRECVIRSHTVIYEDVEIGDRVETGHHVLIREGSRIGSESRIGSYAKLDGRVEVGSRVSIQSGAYLPHLTIVEDDVFIGPGVIVTNDPYPMSRRLLGVRIARGAIIGAGAVLLAGVEIGERAVVGAGAVVTRSIPAGMVAYGCPARIMMTRDEYDEKRRMHEETGD
jgi:acetyltransferase-like isoleucine patch superfamily enzyme